VARRSYSCLQERLFYNSLIVNGGYETPCWEWIANRLPQTQYGQMSFRINGRVVKQYAHRVSYELFKGPIPVRFEVDHKCQNPWCIHPDHLQAIPAIKNKQFVHSRRKQSPADKPLEYT
jgi:HNH endonuclease